MKTITAPGPSASWTLLIFLTLLNILNFADRTLLATLAVQVKEDIGISNTQIGLLTGYVLVLFYTVMGLAMGTLADRWHRPRLIAIGLTLWTVLTAATGKTRNFFELAACRAVIGVGEATLTPTAMSMLSDTFKPRKRAFASGFYYAGIPLGAGMGIPRYGLPGTRDRVAWVFHRIGSDRSDFHPAVTAHA